MQVPPFNGGTPPPGGGPTHSTPQSTAGPQSHSARTQLLRVGIVVMVCLLLAGLGSVGVSRSSSPVAGTGGRPTPTSTRGVVSTQKATPVAKLPTPVPTPKPTTLPKTQPTPKPTTQPTPVPVTVQALAQDNFARPDQQTWGMASDGQQWQADAMNNPLFSLQGQAGVIIGGNDSGLYDAVLGPTARNAMVVLSGSMNSYDNAANFGPVLHWQDTDNWYKAYIDGSTLGIKRDINGHIEVLIAMPFTAEPDVSYSIRFRMVGCSTWASAWPTNTTEPTTWMLTYTSRFCLASGLGGVRLALLDGMEARITRFSEFKL